MRLIDLDAIMAQFPKADFDGDAIENMKEYPHWKIDITGLINVLKAVPIIKQSKDCISREEVIEWLKDKDIIKTKNQEENARRELAELPSVTPNLQEWLFSFNTDSATECFTAVQELKKRLEGDSK